MGSGARKDNAILILRNYTYRMAAMVVWIETSAIVGAVASLVALLMLRANLRRREVEQSRLNHLRGWGA